jgi:hypothetical protein
MVSPEIHGGDDMPFVPVVEAGADATVYEQLAGFLGRDPAAAR